MVPLSRELGIYVAGGKGATSRKTPAEITAACERLGRDPGALVRSSSPPTDAGASCSRA